MAYFGDSGDIEKNSLNVRTSENQEEALWIDLENGCICCSLKGSAVLAIEKLMKDRGLLNYIIIECTGLADPGNLANLFWLDEDLESSIYLDSIVTVVDAKNILKCLEDPAPSTVPGKEENEDTDSHEGPELTIAHLQISHADVIVLNKVDAVTGAELDTVLTRIRAINGLAKIQMTQLNDKTRHWKLDGHILNLHAYDNIDPAELDFRSKGHSHIDPTISTLTLTIPVLPASSISLLDAWLRSVLWNSTFPVSSASSSPGSQSTSDSSQELSAPFEVYRLKGRLPLDTGRTKLIQGVREVFEIVDERDSSQASRPTRGKIVVIGRGLVEEAWNMSLMRSLKLSG
ncbi:cobW-domain-containing protein [Patellaria atrata CBS 101060]|uniref:CobW-domain-containing protein n=1 Tax=Patellaria atrata CBS 101060 TaxID=1346257 RepID=A0A9P4S4W2_9PEZI|nr:cobW-domain-containing protein [Patellaria atrata CBS 101060]